MENGQWRMDTFCRVLKRNLVKCIIFLFFAFQCPFTQAQSASDTSIHIYPNSEVQLLVQKREDYARDTYGRFPGYRVQINFGQDRSESNQVMNGFASKYPGIPTYMSYQQPYFKVNVGDFRTKLEAVKYLNMIRRDYPGAFVVNDKINPPALKK